MRIFCGTILAVATALSSAGEDFAKWVDPFVGTQGDGNCFPGACRPFGMVQPSPDTGEKVHCGGYKFGDETIRGFSQTHLNGTGRPAMGDISLMPVFQTGLTGLTGLSWGNPPDPQNPVNLVNPVQKLSEVAEPGYYAVNEEDVEEVSKSILGNPTTAFEKDAADVNKDGNVDIVDIVDILKIVNK